MDNEGVLLKIVTPGGEALRCACESVLLYVPDGKDGKNGGWVGIRRGHTDTLLALAPGTVKARKDGAVIQETVISGGVAFVENNVVTVLADAIG